MRVRDDARTVEGMLRSTFSLPATAVHTTPMHMAASTMKDQLQLSPSLEKSHMSIMKVGALIDDNVALLLNIDGPRYILKTGCRAIPRHKWPLFGHRQASER
eukprot:9658223-Karenia_brevis.AAC.1